MNKELEEKIDKEGNKKEFQYKGYKCLIFRNPNTLHLCGYVELPKGHRYYEKSYMDNKLEAIEVHGGLTFSDEGLNYPDFIQQKDKWYIGFDCAHSGDLLPTYHTDELTSTMLKSMTGILEGYSDERGNTYKDMEFCTKECKKIVNQIIKIEKEKELEK